MGRKARPWYRTDRGAWYVTVGGKQVNMGLTDPGTKPADLERRFRELMAAAGLMPAATESGTVQTAVDTYLADRAGLRPRTLHLYRLRLNEFAKRFGAVRVGDLKAEQVESWAGKWKCASTRRVILIVVGGALKAAGWSGRLRKPPMRSAGAESVITPEVWGRVLEHTRGDFRQLCRFLWATGCRPGEAAGLTAADFDQGNAVARVREHKTSTHTGDKLLRLPPDAVAVLAEQAAKYPTGALFRNRLRKPMNRGAWMHAFRVVSKKIGVRVRGKFCRHTLATNALQAGVPVATVAALLGHTSTKMIEHHYSHLGAMGKTLADAIAKVRPGTPPAA